MQMVVGSAQSAQRMLDFVSFADRGSEIRHHTQGESGLFRTAGLVGAVSCEYCYRFGRSIQFRLATRPRESFVLLLKEMYPWSDPGLRLRYSVRVNGRWIASIHRDGSGFGPRTVFVPVRDPQALRVSPAVIEIQALSEAESPGGFTGAVRGAIERARTVTGSPVAAGAAIEPPKKTVAASAAIEPPKKTVAASAAIEPPKMAGQAGGGVSLAAAAALPESYDRQPPASFRITGLVDPHKREDIDFIRQTLDQANPTGVKAGFSSEIFYAGWPPEATQARLQAAMDAARETGLPFLPIWSSWWSGTPGRVSDGEGGTFGSLKYQQICWSPTDTVDEPGVRDLLGARWTIRYGLSIPNLWSNTPWLTMNSAKLNAFRMERIRRLGAWFSKRVDRRLLLGSVTDNEPRYWDMDCPDRYPIHRAQLVGDFNPATVAAAARDGIALDPERGLTPAARWWLHQNIVRYIQQTASTLAVAVPAAPVYTHNLTKPGFPMQSIYHPFMETCRVNGARTGIEDLGAPDWRLYERLREWGPWACVNREEGDGQPLETHTAMLQAMYAAGADFVNSYNWQPIQRDRWRSYVQSFTRSLPGTTIPVEAGSAATAGIPFTAPTGCYGMTGVAIQLPTMTGMVRWRVVSGEGRTIVDRVDPASGLLDAGMWTPLSPRARYTLHIEGADGQSLNGAVIVGLRLDLAGERVRSQWARRVRCEVGGQPQRSAGARR